MKKLTIALLSLAVVFLALAVISASYSVNRAVAAIDEIGEVSFDSDSEMKLNLAIEYYNALDTGIALDERVTNADTLDAAKLEYVRLAIKTVKVENDRKAAEGYTDEEIAAAVAAAREAVDTYCGEEACSKLENYADLVALEELYGSSEADDTTGATDGGGSAGNVEDTEEEDIELC